MNQTSNTNLGIKFFAWSVFILIVSVLTLTFRSLKPLELRYIEISPLHLSRVNSPVSILSLMSIDDSPAAYFRYVLQIVGRLKKADARAVIVPIPPSTQASPEIHSVVRKIAAYENVVFGNQLKIATPYQDLTEEQLDDQTSWWSPHPMNHLFRMAWGVSTVRASKTSAFLRIVPYQYRESMYGYRVPDVALEAVKKYAGYSDSVSITRNSRSVSMGTFTIPVWGDGYAYVKSTMIPSYSPIYAFVGPANDSVRYGGQRLQAVTDSTWRQMAGKIVIISWTHMSSRISWHVLGYEGAYLQVINAILNNSFVQRYDDWNLAIIFVMIILAATLVFALRTPLAVIILVAGEGIIVYLSLWLFTSRNIIYDPLYLIFSLTLCLFILPAAKVSHEREFYKRHYELAEEENKRLEEQMRKISPRGPGAPSDPTLPSP